MSSSSDRDIPTVLVPVDFDEGSRRAVSVAIEYARLLHGRVLLLHVVPPTTFPEGTRLLPADASDPVDLTEYVSARAKELLDQHFASVLSSGGEVRKEVRSGHPVETILRATAEAGAKLVVIATHGRTGAARLVLGSIAEGVVRRSSVPVMVVRESPSFGSEHEGAFTSAAAASGAVAGAATGALAGPVGAVAGGAIGTVLGAIAGRIMAREDARSDARDHELDETIGVTHGTIGTPKAMKHPSEAALADAAAEDARRRKV